MKRGNSGKVEFEKRTTPKRTKLERAVLDRRNTKTLADSKKGHVWKSTTPKRNENQKKTVMKMKKVKG